MLSDLGEMLRPFGEMLSDLGEMPRPLGEMLSDLGEMPRPLGEIESPQGCFGCNQGNHSDLRVCPLLGSPGGFVTHQVAFVIEFPEQRMAAGPRDKLPERHVGSGVFSCRDDSPNPPEKFKPETINLSRGACRKLAESINCTAMGNPAMFASFEEELNRLPWPPPPEPSA